MKLKKSNNNVDYSTVIAINKGPSFRIFCNFKYINGKNNLANIKVRSLHAKISTYFNSICFLN